MAQLRQQTRLNETQIDSALLVLVRRGGVCLRTLGAAGQVARGAELRRIPCALRRVPAGWAVERVQGADRPARRPNWGDWLILGFGALFLALFLFPEIVLMLFR